MDPHRKLWNSNHQKLNRALSMGDRQTAIALFLDQHAMQVVNYWSKKTVAGFLLMPPAGYCNYI